MAINMNPIFSGFLLLLVFQSFFLGNANAETKCQSIYGQGKYEEALKHCLEEEDAFKLGYIYSEQNNCAESHRWFRKADSSTAHLNMGIHRIFGSRGCTKDLTLAEIHLSDSIEKSEEVGNLFYMGRLIDIRNDSWNTPTKEAFEYYLSSINVWDYFDSDWEKERRIEANEKVRSFIRKNKTMGLSMVMEKVTNLNEDKLRSGLKVIVAENADDFFDLDTVTFNRFKKYAKNTFKSGDASSIYLKARMLELGIGEIENLGEAYRLYLIAASKGNSLAVKRKEELRTKLSDEERKEAACLAEKGLEPSWIQRQFC